MSGRGRGHGRGMTVANHSDMQQRDGDRGLLPLPSSRLSSLPPLSPFLFSPPAARSLMISDASECEKLHAVLRDLTSVLQAVGRLSEHFTGDFFVPRLSEAQLLVKKICVIAEYSTDTMLCKVANSLPDILDQDFVKL